jgi:predicted GTPase
MEDLIRDFAEKCREKLDGFENAQVKCGIVGPAGSGKSSLINAIFGEKVAATGVVETTSCEQEFTHKSKGLILVDLPGCGTLNWPIELYIERLKLLTYDFFLLVTTGRFTQNDVFLFRELTSRGKPCFVLRNQFDSAVEAGRRDNDNSEEEVRCQIEANIRESLQPSSPERVYLTSAWHPTKYDLGRLLADISDALSGLKRERFIADMAAYSEDSLKKKRAVALELMPLYAGLAAANGLNPIPGLDIAADIALLVKMGGAIAEIFGLTSKQFEYLKRLLGPKAIPSLLAKIAQFAAKYLAKEGVILLLRQIATRMAAKEAAKWVPFVGPLIAAGIGWKATFMLGEQMVDEAESLAREILEAIIRGSDLPSGSGE